MKIVHQGDSCVTPPTPAFGDFQPGLDLYTMGTRIHYFCPQPYQLRGERELVCFPNGKWSYPFPTCGREEHFCFYLG